VTSRLESTWATTANFESGSPAILRSSPATLGPHITHIRSQPNRTVALTSDSIFQQFQRCRRASTRFGVGSRDAVPVDSGAIRMDSESLPRVFIPGIQNNNGATPSSAAGVAPSRSSRPRGSRLVCLPPEICHHIFTFLSPWTLGSLMQTCKLFNVYLDPRASAEACIPASDPHGSLAFFKPDAIWQAVRRSYWPRMPAPLKGCSEADMVRLIFSRRCQLCGKTGTPGLQEDRGKTGTFPLFLILPFAVKTCPECLVRTTCKVLDSEPCGMPSMVRG
jgi:hypothetical protein